MTCNGKLRILVIDDDDEDAMIMSRYLGQMPARVVDFARAASVPEAEEALKTREFDLIFLDLNVGVPLNGMEFLRQTSDRGLKTPIIVVTGSGDEQKAVEAMKSGAYDYLAKDSLGSDLIEQTIGAALQRSTQERDRDRAVKRLTRMSYTDPLTGVSNRRRLVEKLEEEILRSERSGAVFSLLMADLDHFKSVNDRFGHQAGDLVLRECAATLKKHVRRLDLVARFGGEEFCLVLPDTGLEGAHILADKLREAIKHAPSPMPTISVGVTCWIRGASADELIAQCDRALYEAKALGRDRVAIHRESTSPPQRMPVPT